MIDASDEQLARVLDEFVADDSAAWGDSSRLHFLLIAAHENDLLHKVWTYHLLDERDVDLLLVSVEAAPAVFVHTMPLGWDEIRPGPGVRGVAAVRHVLERLNAHAELALSAVRDAARGS